MMAAALSTLIDRGNPESSVRMGVVALFVFCKDRFTKYNALHLTNIDHSVCCSLFPRTWSVNLKLTYTLVSRNANL